MKLERLIIIFPNFDDKEKQEKESKALTNLSKNLNIKVDLIHIVDNKLSYTQNKDNVIIHGDSDIKVSYTDNENTIFWIKPKSQHVTGATLYNFEFLMLSHDFLLINPILDSVVSASKEKTFNVLSQFNVPQPKTIIISQDDIEEVDKFKEAILPIYEKENDKNEYVVKILNGHGGTGVFTINEKNLYSVVQSLFKINDDVNKEQLKLLIQDKKDAKDGDIRVHVLTINNQQRIIGAMCRHKLKNDFRSNVSLGAGTDKVKLTLDQEIMAKTVARASNLPWCAVDIMPLKDGSNVVLEYNSDPGFTGISEALGCNFIELLFKNVKEMFNKEISTSKKQKEWLDCVQKMYAWYGQKFNGSYSHSHSDDAVYCELIDKKVTPDCSGFVGACLCLAGYDDSPIDWNVKFGSFNKDGHKNNDDTPIRVKISDLHYMKDLPDWDSHNFHKTKIKAGDIIYSSFHSTIAADDGAKHLYDWGRHIETMKDITQPAEYYEHKYKYRAYWRLKDETED